MRKTDLILAGRTKAQMMEAIVAGIDKKELPVMESGAMCYMLSKRGYLSDRDGSPIRGLHGRSTNCDHDRVGATGEQVP